MDLNIGAALWLAASGCGRLTPPLPHSVVSLEAIASGTDRSAAECSAAETAPCSGTGSTPGSIISQAPECSGAEETAYCSPARVVLLGHGADEQCAGYGRHRTR